MVFIKRITIQGFKSYKDQVVIEDFSPRQNVVVGRNGSGKSNFFAAIRFVLSDDYNRLDRQERQALLHEGGGTAVMSAYVEIIFDNTDNRFPTGKEEVVLRRTIGLKKDEYSLDKKATNKSDVANLLEAAGFSRANPYYIVPQGRITHLTNAKDSERLNLLKEVAGTQVYEQRRMESLKIMDETNAKKAKIDDLLKYIEERLGELDEEKDELRKFQESDRERRCLEYTIYSRELSEINDALEQLESARADELNDSADRRDEFVSREQQISELDVQIASFKQRLSDLSVDKEQAVEDRRTQNKVLAKAELIISRIDEQEAGDGDGREEQLAEVEREMQARQTELDALLPEYEQALTQDAEVAAELERTEAQTRQLYSKEARQQRYRTKAERDRALDAEIGEAQSALDERNNLTAQFTQDSEAARNALTQTEREIEEIRTEVAGRKQTLDNAAAEATTAKAERDRLNDRRKELWREEARNQNAIDIAKQELTKAERTLTSAMDRNTSRGLDAVRRIAKEKQLAGYYGVVYELLEVEDRYRTAVEVIAGASLFHVVVDTDDTASVLLDAIQREQAGRVTFVPLNRISPQAVSYPDAQDALPMIQRVRFDEAHRKAMEQIFSRAIICPNLETASRYARSHQLNAVTLTGDRSDRKGALTGGYHDVKRSRIQACRAVRKWRQTLEQETAKADEIRQSLLTLDQEITRALSQLQRAEHQRRQVEQNAEPLQRSVAQKTQIAANLRESLARKEEALREANAGLQNLQAKLEALRAERASRFERTLSRADQARLDELNTSLESLRQRHNEQSAARLELEGRKNVLESDLRDNLALKRDRLRGQGADVEFDEEGGRDVQVSLRDAALAALQRIAQRIEEAEREIATHENDLQANESSRRDLEKQNREQARVIEGQQKKMERSMQKKALLVSRKDECSRNIRELGVLPEDAFGKFTNTASNTLVKRLHKVNDQLKQYSHVNKKAFDQYNSFTKQRDQLNDRRDELEQSKTSISDLIEVLDQRKDEAIERTFKQVSKAFGEIFEKLVPQGRGRLIIQRRHDLDQMDEDEDDDEDDAAERERRRKSAENYVGVAISVSFDSRSASAPQQRIQQLSGGQKSLCALALIFAIQRCDPAPFYLMDEVDAALDAQYRGAVADVLQEMANTGQFICTTFRPEMILTGDKFYGVFFEQKLSSVRPIERDNALQFVEAEAPR